MTSILKAVWSTPMYLFGRLRHKKLPEEWEGIKQPVLEGITFYVKYLGSTLVEDPSGDQSTADAIKTIIAMAKASNKKLQKVAMTVCPRGIITRDISSGEIHLDVSIYRISFCSADATFDRVVAFIATNKNEVLECHAFLCSKRRVAQAAALTISQAFNIAFDLWHRAKEEASRKGEITESQVTGETQLQNGDHATVGTNAENNMPLIDLSSETSSATETVKKWGFDKDSNLDDMFSRFSQERRQQMFGSNLQPDEIEDLKKFVASSASETAARDQLLNDQTDDLLAL